MKVKNLLLFAAAASLSLSAFAQESTGEYVDFMNGNPTQDHFFVRGEYSDQGEAKLYENTVSFLAGTPQLVMLHLNDDEIYENEEIQALTPQAYNSAGDLYNEITYNGFQFDVYLPQNIEIIILEDEDTGEEIYFVKGDRMPATSTVSWAKKDNTKEIDGKTYDVYTFTCFNDKAFGSHLSAKNPTQYKNNGALKKDATLLGVYLQNKNQDQVEGRLDDMIIGNTMLVLRETEDMFFYGTGGKGVENRFMQFNRVALYGSSAVVENMAQKTINNVKYYNVAGMESDVPFEGVNIQVTTYNDGTTHTCKVIK